MSIYKKYETENDLKEQRRIANNFITLYKPEYSLFECRGLSTYDYKLLSKDGQCGWLEAKKKSPQFSEYEMIPATKWNFAIKSPFVCWMLVERGTEGKVFNISKIIIDGEGFYKEIARRADQPEGSKKVYLFKSNLGETIY